MLDRFPKPVVTGAAVVFILLAVIIIYKVVTGGEFSRYPSREVLIEQQQKGSQVNGGHTSQDHGQMHQQSSSP